MSETVLTKKIKRAVIEYKPALNSNKRTIRYAEEVDVGTGFVDVIRFEDYIEKDYSYCKREELGDNCKKEKEKFPNKYCHGCVFKRNVHCLGILTTCFEVKISKGDFKSNNGHNFVGNHNYYVVPKELYPKIMDLVPDDVGVIIYLNSGNLRMKKECKFKTIDKNDLSRYLYNALKKWVDQSVS